MRREDRRGVATRVRGRGERSGQKNGNEGGKIEKSGAWGGKQDVELVAQALTNQSVARTPEEASPGQEEQGGMEVSVAMELRFEQTPAPSTLAPTAHCAAKLPD